MMFIFNPYGMTLQQAEILFSVWEEIMLMMMKKFEVCGQNKILYQRIIKKAFVW